jgi:hypothetical protein
LHPTKGKGALSLVDLGLMKNFLRMIYFKKKLEMEKPNKLPESWSKIKKTLKRQQTEKAPAKRTKIDDK